MAGSIFVSKKSVRDLRTIDFAWLASELRKVKGQAEAVLVRVLWPHDEGGMDILQADDLGEEEFKLFAVAIRELYEASAVSEVQPGMTTFLASLLQDIESDARYS